MVERDDRSGIASFFCDAALDAGERVTLDDSAAQHVRVRRLRAGTNVQLLNGRGRIAVANLATVERRAVAAVVERVSDVPRPVPLAVVVPIADRDRMLLAAEKCVELQVTAWQPALFARSVSVATRGEGPRFRDRLRSRMRSALEQSGNAWLPDVRDEASWADVSGAPADDGRRVVLDASGEPLAPLLGGRAADGPTTLAVGPEGGLEQREIEDATRHGWRVAALVASTLRFETALVAGVAIVRAAQLHPRR